MANNWGTSADAGVGHPTGSTIPWGSTGSPGTPSASSWAATAKTDYLELTNFGFNVPQNDVILDITASIKFTTTGTSGWTAKDNSVMIIKGGTISGTDQSAGATWGGTNVYDGVLWGLSWLYSDINSGNFGVAVSGVGAQSTGGGMATLATGAISVSFIPPCVVAGEAAALAENPAVALWRRWTISADGSNHFDRLSAKVRDWLLGACRELGICREQVRDDFSGFMRHGGGWVPRFVQTRAVSFAG